MEGRAGAGSRGREGLQARAADVDRQGGPERRHETLMEQAVERDGLDRATAEAIFGLAEEEKLEPELALLLAATGVGVIELEEVESDPEEAGIQQAPPDWVTAGDVTVSQARWERRLRLSFRRLRALYESTGSAAEAVHRFAAEPDVAEEAL